MAAAFTPFSQGGRPAAREAKRPARSAGFATYSLLEIIIVVCLVALLAVVMLENLLPLRGKAEAARFAQSLGALRSAVHTRFAEAVVRDGFASVERLAHENPVQWLAVPPAAYVGERAAPAPAEIPPGGWVFDSATRRLLYRVRYPEYFRGGSGSPPVIRLAVRLDYTDANGDGRFSAGRDRLRGVALSVLDDYAWEVPEQPETLRLLGLGDNGED